MNAKQLKENLTYLEGTELRYCGEFGCVELEMYTFAGEDMIIYLDELSKAGLQSYIDNFDINEHVVNWWRNGGEGTPFANIKEHYEDYENWLDELQEICDNMPN